MNSQIKMGPITPGHKEHRQPQGHQTVHKKEVKKKNNAKRTPEDCVIAPIFENTDSLTGGLLHVNDDNRVNQDNDRYILQILCL